MGMVCAHPRPHLHSPNTRVRHAYIHKLLPGIFRQECAQFPRHSFSTGTVQAAFWLCKSNARQRSNIKTFNGITILTILGVLTHLSCTCESFLSPLLLVPRQKLERMFVKTICPLASLSLTRNHF